MSNQYFEFPKKKENPFQDDPYSYFVDKPFFPRPKNSNRTIEEEREIKINVLEELTYNLETLQLS